jgi:heptosyltransferase-2
LSLRETAAVLERCELFVGNDSAPMHMAAAADCSVVMISCHSVHGDPMHNNAPERFGPWRVRHSVVRPISPIAPCRGSCIATHAHCILGVTTESVLDACVLLRSEVPPPAPG